MEVSNLYQFVLLLVLVGMILGVGILTLDKFEASSAMTTEAGNTIGNVSAEIATISSDWLGLIVTVAILAIILTLVIRSFAQRGR